MKVTNPLMYLPQGSILMGNHYIKKCKKCLDVISQCRCPDANKEIRWGICDVCAKETQQDEAARSIFMATTISMGLSTPDAMFAWTRFLAKVELKARLKPGQKAAIIIDGPKAKIVPIDMADPRKQPKAPWKVKQEEDA